MGPYAGAGDSGFVSVTELITWATCCSASPQTPVRVAQPSRRKRSPVLDFGWSVGSGPEYLDRTVTLFGWGRSPVTADPTSADYVLVRYGDFVGYLHYFLIDTVTPDAAIRDTMVAAMVEAPEQVSQ